MPSYRKIIEDAKRNWEADPANPPLLSKERTEMIYDHRVQVCVPHRVGVPTHEAIHLPDGRTVAFWMEVHDVTLLLTADQVEMSGRVQPLSRPVGIMNVRFALDGAAMAERRYVRADDVLHARRSALRSASAPPHR